MVARVSLSLGLCDWGHNNLLLEFICSSACAADISAKTVSNKENTVINNKM